MPRSAISRLGCLDIMTGAIVDRDDASSPLLANPFLAPFLVHSQFRFWFFASLSRPPAPLLLLCLLLSRDLLASSSAHRVWSTVVKIITKTCVLTRPVERYARQVAFTSLECLKRLKVSISISISFYPALWILLFIKLQYCQAVGSFPIYSSLSITWAYLYVSIKTIARWKLLHSTDFIPLTFTTSCQGVSWEW